jgi:pimeloyl-ACP methyl ester carboxylesterase
MPSFSQAGGRIDYQEFGAGPRVCVLIHGLLLSKRMHEPLAEDLASRGNRVITVDLLLGCAIAFTPLMAGLTFGRPVMSLVQRAACAVPSRRVPFLADVMLDTVRQDPRPSAAVLQGLFFARVAPPSDERKTFEAPALVIGHRRDPVHPFSDAGMLVDELPNGRLLMADSILDLRLSPDRLAGEIAGFLDECWARRKRRRPAAGSASLSAR